MPIAINGRFLTQTITGVQRYAVELVMAIDALLCYSGSDARELSFILFAPNAKLMELPLKHIQVRQVGHLQGHAWEQLELPLYVGNAPLINLCNVAPVAKRNQVVTIHDAAVFANSSTYSIAFRNWYKFVIRSLGTFAKAVLTDSSFSKRELERYARIPTDKLHVIPLGGDHILAVPADKAVLERHGIGSRPFLLAVSSLSPNKNFHAIVRALEILGKTDFEVVIAGGVNPKVFGNSQQPLPSSVNHIGYVSDRELRALYEAASGFVYPSFYEGFGLPPLEAMTCGCSVIVSNAASLPEVCGDAALYCNPHDPSDIAAKMLTLMSDAPLRDSLRRRGLERAKHFTWERCARDTLNLIVPLLRGHLEQR